MPIAPIKPIIANRPDVGIGNEGTSLFAEMGVVNTSEPERCHSAVFPSVKSAFDSIIFPGIVR